MSPGKFLGKRKRKNGWWRKLAFSPRHFSFSTVRFAHRRPAQALAAQERLSALKPLVVIRSFYGDKVAFSGSLLGFKREHPRNRIFSPSAAFTATKQVSLVLSLTQRKYAPVPATFSNQPHLRQQSCLFCTLPGPQKRIPRSSFIRFRTFIPYSAPFKASTISICLLFFATIQPTISDTPKVSRMLTL